MTGFLIALQTEAQVASWPWGAIVAVLLFAYAGARSILYLKAKEQFVTRAELKTSVDARNRKIEEVESHLVVLIAELKSEMRATHEMLERHYVRREELNGWGDRVKDVEKREDAMVNIMEGIRSTADRATQRADAVATEFGAHVRIMDERLKPLVRLEASVDRLTEVILKARRDSKPSE